MDPWIAIIGQALWLLAERLAWALAGGAVTLLAELEWQACSRFRHWLQGVGRGQPTAIRR